MKNDTSKRVFPRFGDLLLIVILFLLVQCAMLLILKAFGVESPVEPKGVDVDPEIFMSYEEQLGRFNAVMYPVLMFFSIVTIWLYARLRGGKGVVSIKHSIAGFNPSVILVGVLWLVSSQILIEPLTTMMPASDGSSIGRGVWAWITALAFAPIFEELLCRGVLLSVVRRRWGVVAAIVVSALFFGLIHFEMSTALVAFVAGLIFGVIYVRTSSIFSTMIIHSINNLLAFSMVCFGMGEKSWQDVLGGGVVYYIVYGVAALIFLAASIEAYFKVIRRQKS